MIQNSSDVYTIWAAVLGADLDNLKIFRQEILDALDCFRAYIKYNEKVIAKKADLLSFDDFCKKFRYDREKIEKNVIRLLNKNTDDGWTNVVPPTLDEVKNRLRAGGYICEVKYGNWSPHWFSFDVDLSPYQQIKPKNAGKFSRKIESLGFKLISTPTYPNKHGKYWWNIVIKDVYEKYSYEWKTSFFTWQAKRKASDETWEEYWKDNPFKENQYNH